ncbi:MAG: hypothetical protein ABW042_09250 [Phenylobacterium sp.]
MRQLAAATLATCLFAAPAQAQQAAMGAEAADPIGLLLDDPIGLLLDDPIALLLERPFDPALTRRPAFRARNVMDFDLDAQAVDALGVTTGTPVAGPLRRVRVAGISPAELAERAYEPQYAKGWAQTPMRQEGPAVEPPRIVLDGDLSVRFSIGL